MGLSSLSNEQIFFEYLLETRHLPRIKSRLKKVNKTWSLQSSIFGSGLAYLNTLMWEKLWGDNI